METKNGGGWALVDDEVIDVGIARNAEVQLGRIVWLTSLSILQFTGDCPALQDENGLSDYARTRDLRVAALFALCWCAEAAVDGGRLLPAIVHGLAASGVCEGRYETAERCWGYARTPGLVYALHLAALPLALPQLDRAPPRAPKDWTP